MTQVAPPVETTQLPKLPANTPTPADTIHDAITTAVANSAADQERARTHHPQEAGTDLGQAGDMQFKPIADVAALAAPDVSVAGRASTLSPAGALDPTTATGKAKGLIDGAMTQIGLPYVYGSHAWGKSLDCSGLTQEAYRRIGIDIGGNSYAQVKQGVAVQGGLKNAVPGDLVFITGDIGMKRDGHVAIYLGGGKVLSAPHTGAKVEVQDWTNRTIDDIRRYL